MKKIFAIIIMLICSISVYAQYSGGSADGFSSGGGVVNIDNPGLPSSWSVVENTGNYSNIGFLPEGNYTINGRNMAAGDAIGLFYTRNAVQYCAGYLVWGEQYGLSVWGDDDQTIIKDGFEVNEAYIYRLWDNVQQVEVLNPVVVVQTGDAFYSINGMTIVNSVLGQNPIPLSAPTLLTPTNNATAQVVNPTLTWNSVSNATSYRVQVALANTFTEFITNQVVTNPTIELSGLTNSTSHYWRVQALNTTQTSDWSEIRKFTTVAAPQWTINPNTINFGTLEIGFNKETSFSISNTGTVDIQITNAVSNNPVFSVQGLTLPVLLTPGQILTKYIRFTPTSTAEVSGTMTLTIAGQPSVVNLSGQGIAPLSAPTLLTPTNNATAQVVNPTLTWNSVSNATSYRVQVALANTFTEFITNQVVTNPTIALTGLTNSTSYYWRVQALNTTQTSDWSEIRKFTTVAAPQWTINPNTINFGTLEIGFNKETPFSVSNTGTVDIQITNAVSNNPVFSVQGLTLPVLLTPGQILTKYIRFTPTSTAEVSGTMTLTIAGQPSVINLSGQGIAPLSAPTLLTPTNNATAQVVNPTLTWNSVSNATSYRVQVALANTFTEFITNQVVTNPTIALTGLTNSTSYYWRVQALNTTQTSDWSEIRTFATVAAPQWTINPNTINFGTLEIGFNKETSFSISNTGTVDIQITNAVSNNPVFSVQGLTLPVLLSPGQILTKYIRFTPTSTTEVSGTMTFTIAGQPSVVNLSGQGIAPLSAPTLLTPTNNATAQVVNPTLTWNSVSNATSYRVQVALANTFTEFITNQVVTNPTIELSGLTNSTSYYWRVQALNTTQTSDWSEIRKFTTVVATPAVPALLTPIDLATNVVTNPTFSWTAVDNALTYSIQLSTASDFSTISFSEVVSTNSKSFVGLNEGTTYFWRVKAMNGELSSNWSVARTFVTLVTPLAIPTLLTPISGAGNIAINPTLTWEAVPTAESYIVQVSTLESFSNTIYNNTVNTTTVNLSGLNNGSVYYWRIKAVRGANESLWSQTFNFATIPPLPDAPTLVAPANLATSVALNPTLQWNPVTGIDSFLVQVSTSNTFATNVVGNVVLTTSKALSNLQYATQYFWRVRSIKTENFMSNWSDVRSFTTMTDPNSTATVLNIGVLLQGSWTNNIHKEVAVTIELRKNNSGTTLNTSDLYKRVPVFINTNGIASANFSDLESGDYWIVVRASGYLAISSKLKQTIQSGSVVNYDFSTAIGNVYSASMLKSSNGRLLMKCGDLNNSKTIGADDTGLLKGNSSSSTLVPSL